MCGFAGYVGKVDNKEQVLTMMTDAIIHRGPDSAGAYFDEEIALGFRRLSIMDLTNRGDQPFYNVDKSVVLVFNGEIFNHKELRQELEVLGHVFVSRSDTETLIHGYEEWGKDLVEHLRGMYAFVIWDTKKKILFGARDIFGIKPFYYSQMNDTFLFGSEIKSFLAHPNFRKEFNEEVLGNYLSFQFVPTNDTFFKGVFCLPPGHSFTFEKEKLAISRYFEPIFTGDNPKTFEEVVDELEAVLTESVATHMVSDVEIAAYLSSGIDSSYLTKVAKVNRTFTVGFGEGRYSEIELAKEFAASIGVQNDAKVVTADEYWDNISDIQYYMDEPVADPSAVALYFLSAEASRHVKVVLSGEGSDEFFGGYNIYCEPLEHTGFDKIPMPLRRFAGKVAEHCLPRGTKGRGFLMRHGKTLEERYFANATNIFTEREANKILKKEIEPGIQKVTRPLYDRVKDKDPVTKMQYLDLHLWMVRDILMKGDKMGMANGVEVRVPFLDKKVFQFAATLPLHYKVAPPRTKIALRAVADRVIRKETAEKKKLGFPIPIRVWLKDDKYYRIVKDMFSSATAEQFFHTELLLRLLEEHKSGKQTNEKTDHSRKIWTVYVFLVWYERFFGQEKLVHPREN